MERILVERFYAFPRFVLSGGWLSSWRTYWLPNPLLPFIWFRTAVPGRHPEIDVEEYECEAHHNSLEQNREHATRSDPAATV